MASDGEEGLTIENGDARLHAAPDQLCQIARCTQLPRKVQRVCLVGGQARSSVFPDQNVTAPDIDRRTKVLFTALNTSKSAYAAFRFKAEPFFEEFNFVPDDRSRTDRFSCRLITKALLSVFKGRMVDSKGGGSNLERADVSLEDAADKAECRLVVKLFNRHGVTKTYKLTYESVDMVHALFDQSRAKNRFRVHSSLLREYIEYFGAKTEQLNICREDDKVTMTSYTEKIVYGKEVLKQPLQTAITIDARDFEDIEVEELLHIGINVKDFKTIVFHADTLKTSMLARYSVPGRPFQFSYSGEGMICEYTLMTIGDSRSAIASGPSGSRNVTREPSSAARREHSTRSRGAVAAAGGPSPSRTSAASQSLQSRSLGSRSDSLVRPAVQEEESLFVPLDNDDDRGWDPVEQQDDQQDLLGWDASGNNNDVGFQGSAFQNAGPSLSADRRFPATSEAGSYVAPTQRASQVQGLFD